jgi:Spy/CpxP family protein refolding chaperone
MKSTRFLAGVIAGTTLLCAQALISPMPLPPLPAYTAIKRYLNLSDAQLQALQELQESRAAANQAIYKQISDKQTTINNLLMSGSSDALQIGQLTLDINNLRKQLPASGAPFRESALAVLTPEQKNKLPGLTNARQLQPAASQAVGLDLIDGPNIPHPLTFSGTPALIETALETAVQP